MQGSHLVTALIAGALVGAGVWIGATVFGEREPEDPPRTLQLPDAVTADGEEAPPPMLGSSDSDALSRRMGALEARISKLEDLVAAKSKELAPVMQLFEQAKASGMVSEDGTPVPGGVAVPGGDILMDEGPAQMGPGFVRKLADDLGLDAGRKKAMQDAVDQIFDKIKALEKENATVKADGDTTTITIGTYDGGPLKRDWDDWVARNLTGDERAKLEKQRAANRIFGSRLGDHERQIKIKEEGGMIDVSESAKTDDDEVMHTQMKGPAMARDPMLEPYAHLLK